jgi:hypothetical protein
MTVLVLLALVAAVPAAAFGLPAAARTKWARARAEKILAHHLGTPVRIGKIEASWKNGLTLRDVSCKPANYGTSEVTVAVRELLIRPKYSRLLRGKARAKVEVVAPDVRVLERLEPGVPAVFRAPRPCRKEVRIEDLVIREGVFVLRSERSKEEVRVEGLGLKGEVLAARGRIDLELGRLEARLNGGTVSGQGVFALTPGEAKSRVEVAGTGIESNDLVARLLRYVLPLFETVPSGSVRGKVDLRFKAEGSAKDVQALIRSARGDGAFQVREADLGGSRILEAAGKPALRFHEAEGLFTIRDGKVNVLQALARGPSEARLSGWVDADGTMEYAVEIAGAPALRLGGTLAQPKAASGPSAPF